MWTFFVIWIWVCWFWLLIMVVSDVFRRPDLTSAGNAACLIIVLLLPLVGALAYLISQGGEMAERRAERYSA